MATTSKPSTRRAEYGGVAARLREALRSKERVRGLWLETRMEIKNVGLDRVLIWTGWYGVPYRERAEIARAAFSPELLEKTNTIVGLTPDEAIAMGYLPFRVEPIADEIDDVMRDKIRQAMLEEGAIETSEGLQLRYMSREAARDAFVRLQARVPGPYWAIVEEVVRDS